MKTLTAASIALVLSSAYAASADLPYRPVPVQPARMVVPIFVWDGFYAGAQLGYGRQRDKFDETILCVLPCGAGPATVSATGRSDGFLGGVHAGVNAQAGAFVFGLEADLEMADLHHKTLVPLSEPDTNESEIRWQSSVRGRVGVAFDRLLLYVTGGVAFADIKHTYNLTPPPGFASQSFSSLRTGWTLGGGVEYAFTNDWSARVEYRYSDFGSKADAPTIYVNPISTKHRETQQGVRVGVSYHF